MPVYVFQEGTSNRFKIGLTAAASVERRRRPLNSGTSIGLRIYQVLDLKPARAGEAFLHGLLNHRRIAGHGDTEFFEMQSEQHMRVFLEHAVPMFDRHAVASVNLSSLEQIQSGKGLLAAEAEDHVTLGELKELRCRLRELEDEAAILRKEAEILEARLKTKIGTESGIEGVAIWESGSPRRTFSLSQFIKSEPEVYRDVLGKFPMLDHETWKLREPFLYREVTSRFPRLDSTAWRLRDRHSYEQMRTLYFTSKVSRKFVITGF